MSVARTEERGTTPSFARRLVVHPAFLGPLAITGLSAATGWANPARWLALLAALTGLRLITALHLDGWLAMGLDRLLLVISGALFGGLAVAALLPAPLLGRRWRRTRGQPPTWRQISRALALDARTPADYEGGRHRWLTGLGLATVLVTANYAIGYGWDRWWPRAGVAAEPPPTRINVTDTGPPPFDARANDPAMGGASWARAYFSELNSIRTRFWPFVLLRNDRYEGRYINGEGWTRASWTAPKTLDAERPLLSFYGGSTMFGLGQRDQFTIPSGLARIAAAAGYPVDVVNHGVNSFVSWQEMLLFEHFSNAGERPLRAVFYDGSNETYAQRQTTPLRGNPIDTEPEQWQSLLRGGATQHGQPRAAGDDGWLDSYVEHSAVHRLFDEVRALLGKEPAGATPTDDPPSAAEAEQIGEAAVSVYERSRSLIEDVGRRFGVQPAFFWQPVPNWDDPTTSYPTARSLLTPPTTDISNCLADHRDVYLSDSHTNEEGAMLVAGCLWEHLGPTVEAWYKDHGIPRQQPLAGALDSDPVTPALPSVELGVAADALGTGWRTDAPAPNLLATCVTERPVAAVQVGEAYARDQPDIARFAISRITFDSRADRDAAWEGLAVNGGRACRWSDEARALSITRALHWSDEPKPIDVGNRRLRWAATARVDIIDADAELRLVLLPTDDPSALVAVQVIGTDPEVVAAAEAGALAALGS